MSSSATINEGIGVGESHSYLDRVLTVQRLRSLLKKRRSKGLPESLSEFLRHRLPEVYGPEVSEISAILLEIVRELEAEFRESGIDLSAGESGPELVLDHRERRRVSDYAALLAWTSEALKQIPRTAQGTVSDGGRPADLPKSSVAWARLSGDPLQTGISLLVFGRHLQRRRGDQKAAADTYREGIAILRLNKQDGNVEAWIAVLFELYLALATQMFELGQFDESTSATDEAEKLIPSHSSRLVMHMRTAVLLRRGSIHFKKGDMAEALTLWNQALQLSDKDNDPIAHCGLLQSVAILYDQLEHPEKGLELLLSAIAILEETGLASVGAWVYVSAAESYHRRNELERAHGILDRAEKILGTDRDVLPEYPDQITLNVKVTRANILVFQKRYDKAQIILEWANRHALEIDFYSTAVASAAILADLHGKQERYDQACQWLEHAIETAVANSRHNLNRLKLSLALWRVQGGDLDRAQNLLNELEPELDDNSALRIKLERSWSRLHEERGNYEKALAHERRVSALNGKMFERNRQRSIRYARIVAETRMLEQFVDREKELRRRLEHDLAEAVVKLDERERTIEEMRGLVKGSTASSRAEGRSNPELMGKLRSVLGEAGEEKSHISLGYLANVDEGFIDRLRTAYPGLTPKQERLCVLLRAGLNASEICALMEIASEGLKAHRKRVRKAFGLERGERLEARIAEI